MRNAVLEYSGTLLLSLILLTIGFSTGLGMAGDRNPDSAGRTEPATDRDFQRKAVEASQEGDEDEKASTAPVVLPHETVVVTSARAPETLTDTTSLTSSIRGRDLWEGPSLTIDDALRQVPGFSLFRRNTSLSAHPTTQGVSLRGVGPSGTSRSLVLLDGIPLNDPFGGWVYWNRVPRLALDRVEVVRGATSQLYGSSALGGTIQLLTRRPEHRRFLVTGSGGSWATGDLESVLEDSRGDLSYLVGGRFFDSDGFYSIAPELKGPVDRPMSRRFGNLLGRLYYGGWHVGANFYKDRRGNGNVLQNNDSTIGLIEGGFEHPRGGVNVYYQEGTLNSRFSRVAPDRTREFLTADQHFASNAFGVSATARLGDSLLLGSDWRRVAWEDRDQNLWGVFLQKRQRLVPRVELQGGVRLDLWENDSTRWSLSPRAGLIWQAADAVHLRASAYRGFRAPTLNELYRPFRVGNVETQANPALGAESLWGFESGIDIFPSGRWLVRLNAFRNHLVDPVGNVTVSISENGNTILRRRDNLGTVDVTGLEGEATYLLGEKLELQFGYLYSSNRVRDTGLRLPQVPVHQASSELRWRGPIVVVGQARLIGAQYEDDLNDFRLGGFAVFDLMVSRSLGSSLELFLAAENLTDKRYATARTPEERLGEPRRLYAGLRFRLNGG